MHRTWDVHTQDVQRARRVRGPLVAGLVAGTVSAVTLLAVVAPQLHPLRAPTVPLDAPLWTAWWLAAALAAWFGISLALWLGAIKTELASAVAVLQHLSFPGARAVAERVLAIGLLALPVACSAQPSNSVAPKLVLLSEEPQPPTRNSDSPRFDVRQSDVKQSDVKQFDGLGVPDSERLADGHPLTKIPGQEISEQAPAQSGTTGQAESHIPPLVTAPAAEAAPQPQPSPDAPTSPGTHVVMRGDHLWGIAKSEVSRRMERPPSNSEIARYWRQLIRQNRATLISGDPNLIYPGERILLP